MFSFSRVRTSILIEHTYSTLHNCQQASLDDEKRRLTYITIVISYLHRRRLLLLLQ